jgi:radical SAM protein with 4Fe4S-binding SPASM domain
MRKDIFDILWYAKRCGFEILIYTNGSLIDKNLARELARLRPNKVDITIPAMSKDVFERISGVRGSRDKVFKAIDLLFKKKVNLGFKTGVLKDNELEIKDIRDFAVSLSALHRLDDMLSPRLDGSREPYAYRGSLSRFGSFSPFDKCDTTELAEVTDKTKLTSSMKITKLFKCGVGMSQAAITPLGELKMCLMIDYPKYKIATENRRQRTEDREQKTDLKEAWQRLKELVKSIKPDQNYRCDKCHLEPYCKWCPARGWLYNRNFNFCEPESRKKAEVTRQL